ncbi:hypothetical protein TRFO_03915 [Tritrichomonas foetus]|uniref:Uncharacterized protein n=1 Tax=Tritrichomonas foetus TaxID=1144522 RepID=A0A1J4KK56_9EUKA|nr:hypothetical protein TRFO_03915 [Tritrichomonas foetus]|eukprot:OHT11681.1 hypothetical protein TRFO_03915 [Tritrichomonas foetus]
MSDSESFKKSPAKSPKKQGIPSDDKLELRQELHQKAATLQKHIHFEASMKPRIYKMTVDVDELAKECDEMEAKTKVLEKKLEIEYQKKENSRLTQEFISEREKKLQKIRQLEEKLQKVLREKANYLSKAEMQLQGA